jgi:PAS domain S-box-containing protein
VLAPTHPVPPWQAFFETALDGVAILDSSGRFVDVNTRTCDLFGRSHTEIVEQPWTAFAVPTVPSAGLWHRLVTEGRMTGEANLAHPDDSVRLLQFQATANYLPGRHLLVLRDITATRRTERTLRQLALIVESSEDAIYSCTLDGIITSWNPGAARLYGYTAEQILGRSVLALSALDRQEETLGILGRIGDGKRVAHLETVGLRNDGRVVPVGLTVSPILDEHEEVLGGVVIARDINQRKTLEQQLRQAVKMEAIGRLAGGIAHDFNNLLTAINGYSDLLLQDQTLGDLTTELLGEIRQAGERATTLTRQLLTFSRKQALVPTVLSLNSLVSELGGMLRRLIREDIHLHTRLDPDLGQVRADVGQLDQVLMNLVINARDAMPHGGHLTIETRNVTLGPTEAPEDVRPGEYVQLVVRDTGYGMDLLTCERIFEPFFTTKEAGKGTGLGLATVYGIVKQSEGHISVESEPGCGTTFTIYLPRHEGLTTSRRGGSTDTTQLRGSETVLLVEDADAVREVARIGLEQFGYKVIVAQDGEEAWAAAERRDGDIHLLLTDVILPRWDGRQLAEQMCRRYPDLHVLYMSGYTGDVVLHRGVIAEGISFLPKPFTPLMLLRRVREVLDQLQPVA